MIGAHAAALVAARVALTPSLEAGASVLVALALAAAMHNALAPNHRLQPLMKFVNEELLLSLELRVHDASGADGAHG